jgi:LAO/AO transport system kinase
MADAPGVPRAVTAGLIEALRAGDRRPVPRLISLVENGGPEAVEIVRELYPLTGRSITVGITGSPGAGKSSLVDGLIPIITGTGRSIGVIAVDPSSPFSRGAFLGDRTRMQSRALDEGVYIRSMASRGHLGGLSLAAPQAMRVLEAAGFDVVVVETVGVGQSEIEVARQADTTIVVAAPGMGDAIQSLKAGILEVADVFCVNKSDRGGAGEVARDLRELTKRGPGRDPSWTAPTVITSAATAQGLDELWKAVEAHCEHLRSTGGLDERRRERIAAEIRDIAAVRLQQLLDERVGPQAVDALTDEVLERRLDPYTAADELLSKLGL